MAHDDDYQAAQKKSCSQKCEDFMKAIWNSEKKEFIGRTGGSWAKIGLFYLIFYSCLAGFFAIMLVGFFATIDDNAPTQQGMYSLIKGNPGMGFRPMVNVESTLIKFNMADPKSYEKHIKDIDDLLETYKQTDAQVDKKGRKIEFGDCAEYDTRDEEPDKVCKFEIDKIKGNPCTPENAYGYRNGTPCVLLKVNKVYGWKPIAYDNESLANQDDHAAQDAKSKLGNRLNPAFIGVTCEGENEGDADNIYKTSYYPEFGFPIKYFPYYNAPGYKPPLVFVQLDVRKGALIQVWCKLWVKNIKHHKNDKAGSTHFELLVDGTM